MNQIFTIPLKKENKKNTLFLDLINIIREK